MNHVAASGAIADQTVRVASVLALTLPGLSMRDRIGQDNGCKGRQAEKTSGSLNQGVVMAAVCSRVARLAASQALV